ncbi:hypothetical protein, partial [Actinocorallia glomerata]|uniref:hypothetical protein n=1 Tax=Actinocorallia glomerata TaxID=46203 RepID=UPI0031DACED8
STFKTKMVTASGGLHHSMGHYSTDEAASADIFDGSRPGDPIGVMILMLGAAKGQLREVARDCLV